MGDRLATIDMGRKLGSCAPLGELGPHLTQCCLGRGLPTIQPFGQAWAENWGLCPFGEWVPNSPSNNVANAEAYLIPSDILIHPAVLPQQT